MMFQVYISFDLPLLIPSEGFYGYHAGFRTVSGGILGFIFVIGMKEILDQFEDIKIGSIDGEGAHRILLIMFVMTLHSVSEGVGIGVSFGKVISSFSLIPPQVVLMVINWGNLSLSPSRCIIFLKA